MAQPASLPPGCRHWEAPALTGDGTRHRGGDTRQRASPGAPHGQVEGIEDDVEGPRTQSDKLVQRPQRRLDDQRMRVAEHAASDHSQRHQGPAEVHRGQQGATVGGAQLLNG